MKCLLLVLGLFGQAVGDLSETCSSESGCEESALTQLARRQNVSQEQPQYFARHDAFMQNWAGLVLGDCCRMFPNFASKLEKYDKELKDFLTHGISPSPGHPIYSESTPVVWKDPDAEEEEEEEEEQQDPDDFDDTDDFDDSDDSDDGAVALEDGDDDDEGGKYYESDLLQQGVSGSSASSEALESSRRRRHRRRRVHRRRRRGTNRPECLEAVAGAGMEIAFLMFDVMGVKPPKAGKGPAKSVLKKYLDEPASFQKVWTHWKKLRVNRAARDNANDAWKGAKVLWDEDILKDMFEAAVSSLSWWEISLMVLEFGAQVVLLFVSGGTASVIKIALLIPSAIDLWNAMSGVNSNCL